MPKFIAYISIAIGFVLFFEILAHFFFDEIGYVGEDKIVTPQAKPETQAWTLDALDSIIDKKIAERDTVTLEVVTSGFIKGTMIDSSTVQGTYPTIKNEAVTSNTIEKTISIENPDLSDREYFEQLKAEYLAVATKDLAPGRARTDMVVRYYRHAPDGRGIYKLRALRYYIHERDVSDYKLESMPSNALFYGDNIKDEDIKIVAYTLLENGIPIKTIEPSQYGGDWKSNAIEIGADSTLSNKRSLTLSEVRAFIH